MTEGLTKENFGDAFPRLQILWEDVISFESAEETGSFISTRGGMSLKAQSLSKSLPCWEQTHTQLPEPAACLDTSPGQLTTLETSDSLCWFLPSVTWGKQSC